MSSNAKKPLWPVGSLVVLTGLNLLDYLDRQLLAAVLTPIKLELHLSDERLGTLQSAFMWGYFLTSPIFGWLGDRVPRRWLVAAGVFVWSVGTLMSGHVSAFAALLFFRVLVGFGEASFGTISPAWIADLFSPKRRNTAISVFYLAIPVGSALGYIAGSAIAAHHGWRNAFLWAGYPGLALAFVLFLLREPPRGAHDDPALASHAPAPGGWRGYWALLKIPDYRLVVAGYVAQTFAMGGFALWAPTFLYRVHGMSLEAAGRFFGLALVASGLVATISGGLLATAWQRRSPAGYAWVLGLSAALAVPAGFAAFLLPDAGAARVALIVAMFFIFVPTGPINTLILETVPVAERARAMAASIFAIHAFGDLWSPRIVGYISDRLGDLKPAVQILPFALIVSAGLWLWLAVRQRRTAT
ncbi:MAG TPA: MFS transporter [Opitutus sp.]|nr:MFS transporter [Opitutus sp.]